MLHLSSINYLPRLALPTLIYTPLEILQRRNHARKVILPGDVLALLMLSSPTIAMDTRPHSEICLACAIPDKTEVTGNCMPKLQRDWELCPCGSYQEVSHSCLILTML